MAEWTTTQVNQGAGAPAPKKKRSKLIWILILIFILLGAGSFLGYSYMKGDGATRSDETPSKTQDPLPVVGLSPFVVNLVDESDLPRYLKIDFDMELRPGSKLEEVDAKMGELRDAIIVLLTSKSSGDLVSIEGKDRLRDEIITRLNSRLQYSTVNRIFFKEFIIQ